MMIDDVQPFFSPVLVSTVSRTLNMQASTDQTEIEMDSNSNTLYSHLTDHDYINKMPRSFAKKTKRQMKIIELKAIYNCTTCGYRTMYRDRLDKHTCLKTSKVHQDTVKLPEGYEQCSECSFKPKSKSNYIQHMEKHIQSVSKNCTDCVSPKINVDTMYQCSKCNYTTKNPASLKVHMHVHSRGSPFKCTECVFSGIDIKALIKHYDTVKDLRCDCGYATHVKRHMSTHMRLHTGDKPFICWICNYSTGDSSKLHKHMKKKHRVWTTL